MFTARPRVSRFAFCASLIILAGCGRVGPIRPPLAVSPKPASELSVTNTAAGMNIRFRRPTETVDGMDMSDLGYLEVWRSCPPKIPRQRIARIPVIDRGTMRKPRWIELTDFQPQPGDTCSYSIIAETIDGYRSAEIASEAIDRVLTDVTREPRESRESRGKADSIPEAR